MFVLKYSDGREITVTDDIEAAAIKVVAFMQSTGLKYLHGLQMVGGAAVRIDEPTTIIGWPKEFSAVKQPVAGNLGSGAGIPGSGG